MTLSTLWNTKGLLTVIETKTGEIVFTHFAKIPQTGKTYGLITVRTTDDERVELKIDDDTKYKKLKMGTVVTVAYTTDDDSRYPVAKEVKIHPDKKQA
jgi:hypothetical protein